MIVVHHPNKSGSQRILSLPEELQALYEVAFYQRDAQQSGAVELSEIQPLRKLPVITEGDRVIAESGPSSTTSSAGSTTARATCFDLRTTVTTVVRYSSLL
jgi:hypothetical protein